MTDSSVDAQAPSPVAESSDDAKGATAQVLDPVLTLAQNLWWLSLGTVVAVGEQTSRLANVLVEKGRETEPTLREPFKKAESEMSGAVAEMANRLKEMGKSISASAERAQGVLDQKIEATVTRLGSPVKQELEQLSKRVDELTEKVDRMAASQKRRSES